MNKHTVYVPRMDDYMTVITNETLDLIPMAARDVDQAMTDMELELTRALSIDDAVGACLVFGAFAERFHQLERLALARAESLNTTQKGS